MIRSATPLDFGKLMEEKPAPAKPAAAGAGAIKRSRVRAAFVFFMVLLNGGFFFAVIGQPIFLGAWMSAAIIIFFTLYFLLFRRRPLDGWERGALALMGFYVLVSAISNTFFFPKGLQDWLPAFYGLAPLWLIFPMRALKVSSRDVCDAMIAVGVFTGLLLLVDHFVQFSFLEVYQRVATTDISLRRIVFLKSETAFALLVITARLATARRMSTALGAGIAFLIVGFALFVVSESRLAIAASLMACAVFSLFILRGRRAVAMVAVGLCCIALLSPIVLAKYIDQIERTHSYARQDSSVAYRLIELRFFYGIFEKTHGVGFGMMSSGVGKSNQMASTRNNPIAYASQIYGIATGTNYGMYIADLGVMGALVQFGYIGLAAVVWMTLRVAFRLIRIGRNSEFDSHKEAAAMGALALCFLLSPWPTNLYSMDWTAMCGGLCLFLASCCSAEAKELRAVPEAGAARAIYARSPCRSSA